MKSTTFLCVLAGLNFAAQAEETNALARMREADNLAAAGEFAAAVAVFEAVLPAVSNGTHECYAKARLASCLFEAGQYEKAIGLCDEVVRKWPRGSARFTPFLVKADCLTALGRTNEAFRVYREHFSKHTDTHVATEDILKRMEAVKKRTVPTTPPTVPPPAPSAGAVR